MGQHAVGASNAIGAAVSAVFRTGETAGEWRAAGKNVPAGVPDCAELVYDRLELDIRNGESLDLLFEMKNPHWRWVMAMGTITR